MMTEVLDAEMKDECHIMLLVRRDSGDVWEDHGTLRRVIYLFKNNILQWTSDEPTPEWSKWWNEQLDNREVSGEDNGMATE
jgi:hypothetical protein